MVRRFVALLAAVVAAGSAIAQEKPTEAERQALVANGMAVLNILKDPSRCGGAPPPKGYACAVMLYRDASADEHPDKRRDRLPELLTVRVTGLADVEGPPEKVKVKVLSPFDSCTREFSPFGMTKMKMGLFSSVSSEQQTMELKTMLGWAENEALPAGAPRRADPKVFKLPKCKD